MYCATVLVHDHQTHPSKHCYCRLRLAMSLRDDSTMQIAL